MTEEVRISVEIDKAKTLMDISDMFEIEAARLRSLAARGWKYEPPVLTLVKPDPTEVTDRDRLASAMEELEREHKYAAPYACSWEADCLYHAGQYLGEHYDPGEVEGALFWYSEKDDEAFGFFHSEAMHKEFEELPDSMAVRIKWAQDNAQRIEAAEVSERLQHAHLVSPLYLHWEGDAGLICEVLRKHGLTVEEPESPDDCIGVMPAE